MAYESLAMVVATTFISIMAHVMPLFFEHGLRLYIWKEGLGS